jgi:hypothetical protein
MTRRTIMLLCAKDAAILLCAKDAAFMAEMFMARGWLHLGHLAPPSSQSVRHCEHRLRCMSRLLFHLAQDAPDLAFQPGRGDSFIRAGLDHTDIASAGANAG